MQHYIDTATQELFAFEVGTDSSFIPAHLIKCSPRPTEYHTYNKITNKWILKAADKTKQAADITAAVRAERNGLLAQSDWAVLPDCPLSGDTAITAYRQSLRDVMALSDPRLGLDNILTSKPVSIA